MTYLIVLLSTIVLAFYFYIIGYGTQLLFDFKMPHRLVLGMFAYGIVFAIITIPLGVLHVSWNIFFIVVTVVNVSLFAVTIYLMYKKRNWPVWSIKKFIQYIKLYWPVILLISIYMLVYLMNDYTFTWRSDYGAVWDNSYYASKANAAIHSVHILQINPKYGFLEDPVTILVNSTIMWEVFWSYLSSITGLTINQISKLVLPLFIYIGIFFAYDNIFESFFSKKKNGKFYRGYLAVFVMYIFYTTASGMLQGELKKLLYFPWYGNVQITILFTLTTFYFFHRALSEKKWIMVLVLQILFYSVFSAGASMYAGLIYPWLMIYWLFKKEYKFKFDKLLVGIGIIGFLGLNIFYIRSQANVPYIEQDVWINHMNLSMPMFLLAATGVALLFYRKILSAFEQFLIVFMIISIAILLLGPTSTKMFVWYRFALHRYGVSLLLTFMMFGACGIFQMWKLDKKAFLIILLPGLILMQKNYDFFIVENRSELNPAHILNANRESDAVVDIAQFLNVQAKEKKRPVYYCTHSNNAAIVPTLSHQFNTNYSGKFLNIGSMILTETRNVYEATEQTGTENREYKPSEFVSSNCDYIITDSTGLKRTFLSEGGQLVHVTKKDDVLAADIYIIYIGDL